MAYSCLERSLTTLYAFCAVLLLTTLTGCSEQPTFFKLNDEIPLGLGRLTVYGVEFNTLKKYIAPRTYEGALMADQMIKSQFLTNPEHEPVCVLFKYDTAHSPENEENKRGAMAAVSAVQIYSMVDGEGVKYEARLLVPKSAAYYQEPGTIGDVEDFKRIMNELVWQDDRVVAFSMPKNSSDLSLFIDNPLPQKGQPKIAAVSLGQ